MSDGNAKKEHVATAPPPFDPEEYARESESMIVGRAATASMIPTMPPEPSFESLRESCSDAMLAADRAPDSDFQSEVRVLSSAPLPRDIPSLDCVPFVAMHADDLAWFELGADARKVLALIDGCNPFGIILTRSPLNADETCNFMRELLNLGIIELR